MEGLTKLVQPRVVSSLVSKKVRVAIIAFFVVIFFLVLQKDSTEASSGDKKLIIEADSEWAQRRKKLLSDPSRPTKVLLMTYMRGGSSFLGEIFNKNPEAIYWYEVGAQFYAGNFGFKNTEIPMSIRHYTNGTKRDVTEEEKEAVSQFFQALYSCDFDNVPLQTMAHIFLRPSRSTRPTSKCLSNHIQEVHKCDNPLKPVCVDKNDECFHNLTRARQCLKEGVVAGDCSDKKNNPLEPFLQRFKCYNKVKPSVEKCLPILSSTCKKAKIHSAKVHRLAMETLDVLIRDMPDIHIVYYTRDPRGILNSRARTGREPYYFLYPLAKGDPAKAAKYFCPRMRRDLEFVKTFNIKYPGALMTLAYEDLAANPSDNLQRVYSFIGRQVPESVQTLLLQATRAQKSGSSFGTSRKNATETSLKWRETLSKNTLKKIDSMCSDIYKHLQLNNQVL